MGQHLADPAAQRGDRDSESLRTERLESILDASPAIVYTLRVVGEALVPDWVSRNVTRILGYPMSEVLPGSWWPENLHPEDRERALAGTERLLAEGELAHQYRFRHRDGGYRWIHDVARLERTAGGREVVGSWSDITDRVAGEEAMARLAGIVESSMDAIISGRLDGTIVSWNQAAERLFGYTAAEVSGRPISLIHPPEMASELEWVLESIHRGVGISSVRTTRLAKGGRRVEVSMTVSPVRDAWGRVIGFSKIARDVSERLRTEQALVESEQRFRSLVEALGEGVMITDLQERILYTNPRTSEITGFSAEELLGKVASELLLPPEEREAMAEIHRGRAEGQASRYELQQFRRDGSLIWVEVSGTPLRDSTGKVVGTVGAITDISDRKELEQALRRMSTTDVLTGVLNRRGFLELAEREWTLAWRRDHEIVLFYLDLDDFKQINDRFGHAEGDRLLQDVASLLRRHLRSTDVIARMGGDEFVVLAVDADSGSERAVMDRIRAAVEQFNHATVRPYRLSLSIGIHRARATAPAFPPELLTEADRRMYQDKQARKAGDPTGC